MAGMTAAVAEFKEHYGTVSLTTEEYNRLLMENARLETELQRAKEELAGRKTAETLANDVMQAVERLAKRESAGRRQEIQIPAFVNNRNREVNRV